MDAYYAPQDPSFFKRERAKAKELRKSQWWRNLLGSGECYYCSNQFEKSELTMDHKIPISRGGKSTKSNIVLSCKSCNSRKKNHTLAELSLSELHQNSNKS